MPLIIRIVIPPINDIPALAAVFCVCVIGAVVFGLRRLRRRP